MALSRRGWFWILAVVISTLLILIGLFLNYLRQGEKAEAALTTFCESHGGWFGRGNRNSDFWIHLENAHLNEADMKFLKKNWDRLVSHDVYEPGVVRLYFSNATIEGDFIELLDKKVLELDLDGLPIDDADMERIVKQCPRLGAIHLAGTQITDKSLALIKKTPVWRLDVRDTNITHEGLCQLPFVLALSYTRSNFTEEENDAIEKHLESQRGVDTDRFR